MSELAHGTKNYMGRDSDVPAPPAFMWRGALGISVANNFPRPAEPRATAGTHRRWRTKKGPGEGRPQPGEGVLEQYDIVEIHTL